MRRLLAALAWLLAVLVVLLFTAWGTLALDLDGPGRIPAGGYALVSLMLLAFGWPRERRAAAGGTWLLLALALLAWWFSIEPRNDRNWLEDVSRLPTSRREGERIVFSNVRNFEYRSETDFTPHWEERAYDLAKVRGVDLVLSDWGAKGIVHTIVSFEFEGGEHLAISIETRKEVGEGYSAVRGFYRQFELYYAVADERDVLGVRARFRGEHLRLYRLDVPPDEARALLLSYARRVDDLAAHPAWYNAVTANCTTTIRLHTSELGLARPWDWRLLVNGRIDELLYERGAVATTLPFAQLRAASDVTAAAIEAGAQPDFSARIRAALPPRPVRR